MNVALREDPGPEEDAGDAVAVLTKGRQTAEWVRRCQAGEQGVWRRLYDQQFPMVYRLVRRMGVLDREAADVCQDVFLRAFRKINHFRGEAQFSTWLCRITINEVHRAQRSGALRRTLMAAFGREQPKPATGPEQSAVHGEAFVELQRILVGMKQKQRTVFVLHELEDLSTGEIAKVLGVSAETVKSRLRLARVDFERQRRKIKLVALSGGKQ